MRTSWIVEGTPFVNFRFALMIAQIIADTANMQVPVIRSVGREQEVARIIEPKA